MTPTVRNILLGTIADVLEGTDGTPEQQADAVLDALDPEAFWLDIHVDLEPRMVRVFWLRGLSKVVD